MQAFSIYQEASRLYPNPDIPHTCIFHNFQSNNVTNQFFVNNYKSKHLGQIMSRDIEGVI